jgi:serine/threonine protein phosphatase 1
MRTLAIGDVHGASSALDALLAAVRPTPADTLIFLGDYVDRGPDSRGVLDRLLALRDQVNLVCLRGNHELMMLRARDSKDDRRCWLSVGGAQCLASYGNAPGLSGTLADVPAEHWRFLEEQCVDSCETATHIFVHANLSADRSPGEEGEEKLFWEFLVKPVGHVSGKVVVCGHTSQKSGAVLDLGDTICIDTFAYGGGWLTCLDVDRYRFWQADVLGRLREGELAPR